LAKPRSFYETVKVAATKFEPPSAKIVIEILINTWLQSVSEVIEARTNNV
jgi:hypothetical protein